VFSLLRLHVLLPSQRRGRYLVKLLWEIDQLALKVSEEGLVQVVRWKQRLSKPWVGFELVWPFAERSV